MKKNVLKLAAVLTLGISVNSYAAALAPAWIHNVNGTVTIPITTATIPMVLKPSANIFLGYGNDAAGTAYVLLSTHATGTFTYGTSSGDTNIFRLPSATTYTGTQGADMAPTVTLSGGSIPAVPAINTGATWTGWTAAK